MNIEEARVEDAREVMNWFPDKESIMLWGSPYARAPLKEDTFFEDIRWGQIESRVGRGNQGELLAFGQFYQKLGRCHLARLVVNPDFRRRGVGLAFISKLMEHGGTALDTREFSLYVMTANKPAWHCYKSLGFEMRPYPDVDPHLDNCVFMVAGAAAP
ncbi:MAG: GNAT family N-acetyltransferase [Gammaproteobacteria bacterium]|nr:GNAT family N-acetyltransferase [Gammaproteobacteria bacterium]NNJ79217.1 GNAT family N-acetyltransferase [Xanthomonadales bacterium]